MLQNGRQIGPKSEVGGPKDLKTYAWPTHCGTSSNVTQSSCECLSAKTMNHVIGCEDNHEKKNHIGCRPKEKNRSTKYDGQCKRPYGKSYLISPSKILPLI